MRKRVGAIRALGRKIGRPVKLMEVCGTHTMAAFRSGLRHLLPENVSLLSGPGCPVCVTPNEYLDRAIAIAEQSDTMVATFGDMVRVPGTRESLETVRAGGARIHVVYSPAEAVVFARENPGTRVVFLGVGFETTTPAIAWTIKEAAGNQVDNYSVLCGHKTIPRAMSALCAAGELDLDGFICPGHVSIVIGADAYGPVCRECGLPCVVTGFEAADMLQGVEMLLRQIAENRSEVENQYTRCVRDKGNTTALGLIEEVFEQCDASWRGIGVIPGSGLKIRGCFAAHDADRVFEKISVPPGRERSGCICGQVMRGIKTPHDCALFGKACTPSQPVGACMVSSEGTCAAYYKYARKNGDME
ncbi:MAG: hydrogenase formation protein HypD [Chitinivibrionales bacterium]|nr:hydrogenase formation protein HypD [Chitinivibrionales bacterium]MBD3395598.1 hydrogenase formation protein HypD [Chitinivibrionales bacterium]